MSPAALATLAVAVMALHSSAFHGWLHFVHRRGRIHLWHALTSLSVCGLAGATVLLYGASDLAEAKRWQNTQLLFAAPLIVSFLQFSWEFLNLSGRLARGLAMGFSAVLFAAAAFTDRIFEHRAIGSEFPALGLAYVRAPLSDFGVVLILSLIHI